MSTLTQTQTITADNVLRLFPDVESNITTLHQSPISDNELEGYDAEQIRLMEEMCIVLDENDIPIGRASKKVCTWWSPIAAWLICADSYPGHLIQNIDSGLLHRAFSVFLFDSNNKLLLQQRAHEKITFPDMWTNTCCSHPLDEPGETGVGAQAIEGAKRAAQRKLEHELGIKASQVSLEQFQFLTRIHYKAPCGDGKWGEHESEFDSRIECCYMILISHGAS